MTDYIDGSDLHLLPGDAYPGLLGRGAQVTADRADGLPSDERLRGVVVGPGVDGGQWDVAWADYVPHPSGLTSRGRTYDCSDGRLLLDLRILANAHRVRDVLEMGVECDCAKATTRDCYPGETVDEDSFCPECDAPGGSRCRRKGCPDCGGTGYRIASADLWWTRTLPAWQAAAILAASVLRVVRGSTPIRGLIGDGIVVPGWGVVDGRVLLLPFGGSTIPVEPQHIARVEAP